jgi:DNA-binding transcriptional ArsR family regulator
VITIALTADDLSRIRFAFSPIWETVTSVRAVATGAHGLHRPWLRRVAPVLAGPDLELLRALVPSSGYIPDFLTPAPRRSTSGDTTAAGRPRARQAPWVLAEPDLSFRLEELAGGGVHRLFRTLHPSVTFTGDLVRVDRPYSCDDAPQSGQGLVLVPSVFSWPMTLVVTAAPYMPTLTYPPRGIGRLWEFRSDTDGSPLADLVGKTRAAIVGLLDLPMSTTQLACQLNLSAPTLSIQLGILRAAGVVESRRDGRAVLYSRTRLGDLLLDGVRAPAALSAQSLPA